MTDKKMTLKEFALDAGVVVFMVDKNEWGGSFAYREKDHPNSSICGYKTEHALYKAWAEDKFGKQTFKALSKLLNMKP